MQLLFIFTVCVRWHGSISITVRWFTDGFTNRCKRFASDCMAATYYRFVEISDLVFLSLNLSSTVFFSKRFLDTASRDFFEFDIVFEQSYLIE